MINLTEYDFERLRQVSAGGGGWITTLAYWIGILSEFSPEFTCDAYDASLAMGYQYDVEEQANDADALVAFRDIALPNFLPIAPVTLALRWSPFPAAMMALGPPAFAHCGKYGSILAVFHPIENATFPATVSDERHFRFLLSHACHRGLDSDGCVLLAGSPGWSYESEDWIAAQPDLQHLMAEFGFVSLSRKPTDTLTKS
jgi:hypothetical protein